MKDYPGKSISIIIIITIIIIIAIIIIITVLVSRLLKSSGHLGILGYHQWYKGAKNSWSYFWRYHELVTCSLKGSKTS